MNHRTMIIQVDNAASFSVRKSDFKARATLIIIASSSTTSQLKCLGISISFIFKALTITKDNKIDHSYSPEEFFTLNMSKYREQND